MYMAVILVKFSPIRNVSGYRDPQLQVGEIYSYLFNLRARLMFKHSFQSQ